MLALNMPVSQGMGCALGISETREDVIVAHGLPSSDAQIPIATGWLYDPKMMLQHGCFIGSQSPKPQLAEVRPFQRYVSEITQSLDKQGISGTIA